MARGQSVYQGAYNFPVQSTAAQSIQQGAQAQAQMYSSLGQAIGKAGSAYFEKKEEDKQIDAIVDNPEILDLVYRGQTDMPAAPKERRKDVKALFKGLGGREGVENYLMRDRAEQRAQEMARQRDVVFEQLQTDRLDSDRYVDALLKSPDVTDRIPYPGLEKWEGREGETLGEVFPGLKPLGDPSKVPTPEEDVGVRRHSIFDAMAQKGEVVQPTAQPEPSYASRLMGGLRGVGDKVRRELADVRIPEALPTQEVTRPGQSLLARSPGMTGPAFAEAFMLQNPDATPGMKRQLARVASAMPQRAPERPEFIQEGNMGYLFDPVTGKYSAPFPIPEAGKVGRDAMDTAFAKEMIDYKPTDVRKNLVQLQEAIDTLEGVATQRDVDRDDDLKVGEKIDPPDSISGWFVGFIPEAFRDVTHPRSAEVREAIQEVVQRNLRPILGSAFGEKEGEQVLARAFNPKLDEVENLKRVKRLFTQMEDAHREYMKKRAYFEENLTLKGYKGQSLEELWDGFGLRLPAGAERQLEHRTVQQIVDYTIQTTGGDVENVKKAIDILETSDDPSMPEDSRLEAARMLREHFKL